jgi:hypothetical protein
LGLRDERQPGGPIETVRSEVFFKDAANNILIDNNAEGMRDLLSNAHAAKQGLVRFSSMIAKMSSADGPFGPALRLP